jgi:hypothetical protein
MVESIGAFRGLSRPVSSDLSPHIPPQQSTGKGEEPRSLLRRQDLDQKDGATDGPRVLPRFLIRSRGRVVATTTPARAPQTRSTALTLGE